MNWRLLIFDLLAVAWLGIVIYLWPEQDNERRTRDIVMGALILFWRIGAHYNFYKKSRRVY